LASLDNVKILLGITDTSQDALLNLYLSRATNFVKNYCNVDEIPLALDEVVEDIAVVLYRKKGVENIQEEKKGSLWERQIDFLPKEIVSQLDAYRRVKFI
jgi:hypothetical protein